MDLNQIPRRQRRFYRKEKIMHHMVEEIKKGAKLKLEEKKKILEALRKKIEEAKEEELNVLAENLFTQTQKKDLGKITAIEIQKNRIKNPEQSELNFGEIADNVYMQLMTEKEIQKWREKNRLKGKPEGIKEKIREMESSESRRTEFKADEEKPREQKEEKLSIEDLGLKKGKPSEDLEKKLSTETSKGDDFNLEGLETDFGLDARLKKKKG